MVNWNAVRKNESIEVFSFFSLLETSLQFGCVGENFAATFGYALFTDCKSRKDEPKLRNESRDKQGTPNLIPESETIL